MNMSLYSPNMKKPVGGLCAKQSRTTNRRDKDKLQMNDQWIFDSHLELAKSIPC